MTKTEACEFLGVSERTLDKHARQGRLTVQYLPGKTGRKADFDQDELERLKVELEAPQPTATGLYTPSSDGSTATPQTGAIVPLRGSAPVAGASLLVLSPEHFPALAQSFRAEEQHVRVSEKLTLSLDEAAALSGFSARRLRQGITEGKLHAVRIGRGYKLRGEDLRAFVNTLFDTKQ